MFEHSQKQHLYYLPQEKESPVKPKKHKKKKENGFPKLRGDGRQVSQELPHSLGGKQFPPSQMAKNSKAMAPKTRAAKGEGGKARKKDKAALEKQILEPQEQLRKRKKDDDEGAKSAEGRAWVDFQDVETVVRSGDDVVGGADVNVVRVVCGQLGLLVAS